MVAGTVRRRGESWQAILNFRDPRTAGKVVQFTATRRTKREAEKALAELIVRRDREGLVRANQTFGQATTKWREAGGFSTERVRRLRHCGVCWVSPRMRSESVPPS